ncbi:Diaminopimelate decarboxylase [BD1-7 clade bacterium]|uniref:Diaminopimelate decarboxylase n=1 Tax=BD1-7 clade bacterium TaxID=2029982 RepID=A0A5S9P603_9GAMM|nr:Diaminopimelate decarboxylase [BD1-7 clade bacterium]
MNNTQAQVETEIGPWWQRDDLSYKSNQLFFAGQNLNDICKQVGTPTFVYSAQRVRRNIERLHHALSGTGLDYDIYYAMKANRNPSILTHLCLSGLVGIDACSPQEVLHAMSCGFRPQNISFTGTSVSKDDWQFLFRQPNLKINIDSLSALKHFGEHAPGQRVGIRINPALGVGYSDNALLQYSGRDVTKFGIYQEQLDEALAIAAFYDVNIHRVHFHTGCGYLNQQLPVWSDILEAALPFIESIEDVREVNLGGGLGVPHTASDQPLDLEQWQQIIRQHFGGKGLRMAIEPGDYVLKDAGLILLETTYVEQKRDKCFVGVNGGFNLAPEPSFYSMPCEPAPCALSGNAPITATIAGNINESLDVWARDVSLPALDEGDYLALLNAGGYAAAMSSNHCMRGEYHEIVIP